MNTGNVNLSFGQLAVFVNNKPAIILNAHVIVFPGGIATLVFSSPEHGEDLFIAIRGPDNLVSYTIDILEAEIPVVCMDGICSEGENCPDDLVSCTDRSCFVATCINGCGEIPVLGGATDESCFGDSGCEGGSCYCDGAGNCVSGYSGNGGDGISGGGSSGSSGSGGSGGSAQTATCSDNTKKGRN